MSEPSRPVDELFRDVDRYSYRRSYKSRELLVYMSPDQFLRMAAPLPIEGKLSPRSIDNIVELVQLMRGGTQMAEVPFLDIGDFGKIHGHEGRHRANALRRLGYKKMPVRLRSLETYGPGIRWSEQSDPRNFDFIDRLPDVLISEDSMYAMEAPYEIDGPRRGRPLPEYVDATPLDLPKPSEYLDGERVKTIDYQARFERIGAESPTPVEQVRADAEMFGEPETNQGIRALAESESIDPLEGSRSVRKVQQFVDPEPYTGFNYFPSDDLMDVRLPDDEISEVLDADSPRPTSVTIDPDPRGAVMSENEPYRQMLLDFVEERTPEQQTRARQDVDRYLRNYSRRPTETEIYNQMVMDFIEARTPEQQEVAKRELKSFLAGRERRKPPGSRRVDIGDIPAEMVGMDDANLAIRSGSLPQYEGAPARTALRDIDREVLTQFEQAQMEELMRLYNERARLEGFSGGPIRRGTPEYELFMEQDPRTAVSEVGGGDRSRQLRAVQDAIEERERLLGLPTEETPFVDDTQSRRLIYGTDDDVLMRGLAAEESLNFDEPERRMTPAEVRDRQSAEIRERRLAAEEARRLAAKPRRGQPIPRSQLLHLIREDIPLLPDEPNLPEMVIDDTPSQRRFMERVRANPEQFGPTRSEQEAVEALSDVQRDMRGDPRLERSMVRERPIQLEVPGGNLPRTEIRVPGGNVGAVEPDAMMRQVQVGGQNVGRVSPEIMEAALKLDENQKALVRAQAQRVRDALAEVARLQAQAVPGEVIERTGPIQMRPSMRQTIAPGADKVMQLRNAAAKLAPFLVAIGDMALAAELGYNIGQAFGEQDTSDGIGRVETGDIARAVLGGAMETGADIVEGTGMIMQLPQMGLAALPGTGYEERAQVGALTPPEIAAEGLAAVGRGVSSTMNPYRREQQRKQDRAYIERTIQFNMEMDPSLSRDDARQLAVESLRTIKANQAQPRSFDVPDSDPMRRQDFMRQGRMKVDPATGELVPRDEELLMENSMSRGARDLGLAFDAVGVPR